MSVTFGPTKWLVSGFAAAAFLVTSQPGSALEDFKMRVDWAPYNLHAPYHFAVEKGWFKDAGLNVKVDDGNGSVLTIQMTGAGAYDVGHANLGAMAAGVAKGASVKAVGGIIRKNDMGTIVDSSLGVTSMKDIVDRGYKLITTPGGFDTPFMKAIFKAAGADPKKVKYMNVAASAKISSYLTKKGEAVSSTPPYFGPIVESKRPSNFIYYVDYGLQIPGFGLVASTETINDRPDVLRKYLSVMSRAWKYAWSGDEAVKEMIAAMKAQRPQAKIKEAWELKRFANYRPFSQTENTTGKGILYQSPIDWERAVEDMEEADIFPKGKFKAADFFTNEFLPGGGSS